MKSILAICWWALALIFFTGSVKSTSFFDVDDTNYRLPNETYPEHYNIELTTNVHSGERAFKGEVTIDIMVVRPTSKIVLHASQLKISKATVAIPFTDESEDLSIDAELNREFLTLTRRSGVEFSPEKKWKLTIIYSGELRDDNIGFYLSKYKHDDGNYHYFASTQFTNIFARHAFPCYDEPNKRANFTITINHSPTYVAISNMPVNVKLSSANRTVFLTTPSMPTYTVAFMVCDFEYTEAIDNNVPQRIYSRPNKKNLHRGLLPIISQITTYVSDYFDIDYMLPKMDHVEVPNFPVPSLENWGLVMYDEETLLSNFTTSDLSFNFETVECMAHEIVHQWISNYVTISSWPYFWLTESLSSFYAHKILNHIYPESNAWELYQMLKIDIALHLENGDSSILLTNHAQTPTEILQNTFAVHKKGSCVMRMWNNALTDKVFQKALRNFLRRYQFKAVGEEELFSALQEAVKEEKYEIPATINEMISTWTTQSGFPILTVSRNYTDGTFTIKQETFYINESKKDSKTWYVPINYAVASNPNFSDTKATHYLRNVTETNFTDVKISNNDWLILNKQSIGYYHVNYDVKNWNLIIQSLTENPSVIHSHNRAQFVRDAIALWKSNRLDVSVLFKLFTYLKKEDDYLCWYELFMYFNEANFYLMTNKKYDDFKYFFAEQLSPIYGNLRLVDKSRDNHYQSQHRFLLYRMASFSDINQFMEDNYNRLKDHLKGNKTLTREELNCNAIKMSDDELFNTLYQKLIDANETKTSKTLLIYALSCHRNVNLIKKLLRSSIDKSNHLENNERYLILKSTCLFTHLTFSACMEFLNENWNAYGNLKTDTEDSNPLSQLILNMASNTYDKDQEDQLLALVNKVKDSKHVTATLEIDVKNKISKSLKESKKYVEQILPWVTEYRREAMQRASGSK